MFGESKHVSDCSLLFTAAGAKLVAGSNMGVSTPANQACSVEGPDDAGANFPALFAPHQSCFGDGPRYFFSLRLALADGARAHSVFSEERSSKDITDTRLPRMLRCVEVRPTG